MNRVYTCLATAIAAMLMTTVAEAESVVTKLDFAEFRFNFCTGEVILVTGTAHLVSTDLGNGEVMQHVNVQGSGVSNLGVTYQFHLNNTFTTDGPDFVSLSRTRLIGPGPSNNQFLDQTISFVGGVLTIETEIDCR